SSASGTAPPPITAMAGGKRGARSSKRASVPSTRLTWVAPSSRSRAIAPSSKRSCRCNVAPESRERKTIATPPTWKSGSAQTNRDDASTPSTALAARALARWLSSASKAAFGAPVVPDVKRIVPGPPAGGETGRRLRTQGQHRRSQVRRSRAADRSLQRSGDDHLQPARDRPLRQRERRQEPAQRHRLEHHRVGALERPVRILRHHLVG